MNNAMARMEFTTLRTGTIIITLLLLLLAHHSLHVRVHVHVTALSTLPPSSRRDLLRDQLLTPMLGLTGATTTICAHPPPAIAVDEDSDSALPRLPFTRTTTMLAKPTTTISSDSDKPYTPSGEIWRTASATVLPATPSSLAKIMQMEVLGPTTSSTASRGIVCISERHDDFEHHKVQLKVLMTMRKVLVERSQSSQDAVREKLSIGMEMFQRQHQKYLDEFIAQSDYGIGDLKRDTNWDVTWGYDILHYLPLLLFAKKFSIRILGLHPSDHLVEQVERHGLESDNTAIASIIEGGVCTDDREHAHHFKTVAMQRLSLADFGCQEEMDAAIHRQYEVQCFREDYMAESAAMGMARQSEDGWVVLLAGEQHILGRNGIPFRALRRFSRKSLSPMSSLAGSSRGVFTIVPKTVSSFPIAVKDALGMESADYVWYVQRDPSSKFREDKVNNAPLEIEALYLRQNGNGILSTLGKR